MSRTRLIGVGLVMYKARHTDSFDERQWRHAKMLPSGVKVWGSSLLKQPFFESESGSKSKITVMYNSINPGHG